MSIKPSKIKTVKSYIDTLRSFSTGEVRYFLLVDTDYTGFHNAKKRIKDSYQWEFDFSSENIDDKKYFKVKRIK